MEKTIDLGFTKLDMERKERTGFAEVVFCEGKADSHLIEIFRTLLKKNGTVLGTRASPLQAQKIKEAFHSASVEYDSVSRILTADSAENAGCKTKRTGLIAVCSAGTADIPVAEEAARTAEYFGANVERFFDVGVAGLHRLLEKIEGIRKANAVIAVAGMEGALPSVLGGLVSVPVICVPTSVGYGASFGGISALLSMLNSCANGISVVNIDNGYGAGYIACQINQLAEGKR
ncbi:nickel pincer cofactor biosynthesis protein LarB [Treponema sp.]|uniref:nickel pincer cofactor biosynthesis protein LarB n=1 Tax=Treponema sp. TaxID=166 RepID=UPI003EFF88E9